MRLSAGARLLGFGLCLQQVLAAHNVVVNVTAAFERPPFLLELLETTANENSSSFFPILRDIGLGRFAFCRRDEELFYTFLGAVKDDGHITDEASLATWNFGLSLHESAPRITAQGQFWASTIHPSYHGRKTPASFAVEVWTDDNGLCTSDECSGDGVWYPPRVHPTSNEDRAFDRVYGDVSERKPWTVYIDVTDDAFSDTYMTWVERFQKDNIPYRVRYKPSMFGKAEPLIISGYGVELALKKTDYIVIDDRGDKEDDQDDDATPRRIKVNLDSKEIADIKPLSSSELRNLGLNTASFIMDSENPLDTLNKISGDFPKHAAALASHNASDGFVTEHRANRNRFVPAGYNVIWINGVAVDTREFDAFSLIEQLRSERALVRSLQALGLSAPEAIDLLSHQEMATANSGEEPQRYVFSDEAEGGNVILWMNDIEKDKRYAEFPNTVNALLQRVFPGQLPSVRKDLHNVVFPVDLSDRDDVLTVVETMQTFVKRLVPVRFGLVPLTSTAASLNHASVLYYLSDTYGLAAAMEYLEKSLPDLGRSSNSAIFNEATEKRKARPERVVLPYNDVLSSTTIKSRIDGSRAYLKRLGSDGKTAPILGNGVALPKDDEWLQAMSQRLAADLQTVQKEVFEGKADDDTWLPSIYLQGAVSTRNPLIVPEDEKAVKLFDLAQLETEHAASLADVPLFRVSEQASPANDVSVLLLGNLNGESSAELILNAVKASLKRGGVALRLLQEADTDFSVESMAALQDKLQKSDTGFGEGQKEKDRAGLFLTGALMSQSATPNSRASELGSLSGALGLDKGELAILVNGRLVGPVPVGITLSEDDLDALFEYESKKRIAPVEAAVAELKLASKLEADFALARLTSLVALSTVSDVPEGIFDNTPEPRIDMFKKWETEHTCIEHGKISKAAVQVVASIDPTSELAQRWIPVLMALVEMNGVHLRIFLNPKERLTELPTKRFYRHVLHAQPAFELRGGFADARALFRGLPRDALLTMALDVPPAWVVAAKDAVQDLDNIKLSALRKNADIEAQYELEYILIEGHSRDTTVGSPPRGAQLALSSGDEADYASTIVMANLGYFQFKANPGLYRLALKQGASADIWTLDSAGTEGQRPRVGDETADIELASFKGATIFPRLSRRPGQEEADVLDPARQTTTTTAAKVGKFADDVLDRVGIQGVRASELIAQAFDFGQTLLGKTQDNETAVAKQQQQQHADINIFSVASGHLYERMLNIMMVSVMRHTDRSVKFWFIEQFLSPSFKKSIPTLAEAYGFEYEMVTYKWPHWLRAQKEKQRVIWGYKILFLDVLFPLDLDKVIFVDADQIVRTDMMELVQHNLEGAPYGFTPMCDSRTEMEGFRFWKQGYWKSFLRGLPYHISALYVVDLKRFRELAAGDRLRGQYHSLSADPNSLSNLDQDLPNHMQAMLPIHSLPQEWLWCETWCSDESLAQARTIDLCNNPQTKEPKLDRARRQVPEWTTYDDEIAAVLRGEPRPAAAANGQGPPANPVVQDESAAAAPEPETEPDADASLKAAASQAEATGHEEL